MMLFKKTIVGLTTGLVMLAQTGPGAIGNRAMVPGFSGVPSADAAQVPLGSQVLGASATQLASLSPEAAFADYLAQIGATLYGTKDCRYCRQQRKLFGAEGMAKVTYVECDPRVENAQYQRCVQAGITSFPTWEINGRLYRGRLNLDQLAKISGYQGNRSFSNWVF